MDLARHLPRAKFVVEDSNAEGLNMGRQIVGKDPDLERRITFLEHDFFKPQPVQADVYFLRHILIDWPDAKGIEIIRALIPALKDGARVLLSEAVMPEPPAKSTVLLEDKQVLYVSSHLLLCLELFPCSNDYESQLTNTMCVPAELTISFSLEYTGHVSAKLQNTPNCLKKRALISLSSVQDKCQVYTTH